MNPRDYLRTHPLILAHVERMQRAGLQPDTISRIVDESLMPFIPSMRTREEIIRIIRRTLKSERTETIESDGMGGTEHFIPSKSEHGGRIIE